MYYRNYIELFVVCTCFLWTHGGGKLLRLRNSWVGPQISTKWGERIKKYTINNLN